MNPNDKGSLEAYRTVKKDANILQIEHKIEQVCHPNCSCEGPFIYPNQKGILVMYHCHDSHVKKGILNEGSKGFSF